MAPTRGLTAYRLATTTGRYRLLSLAVDGWVGYHDRSVLYIQHGTQSMPDESIQLSFQGRVALVAGAGGGKGLYVANDLMRVGAKVSLADIKPKPEENAGDSNRHLYYQGDLSRA